jgi:hypothetical protein
MGFGCGGNEERDGGWEEEGGRGRGWGGETADEREREREREEGGLSYVGPSPFSR